MSTREVAVVVGAGPGLGNALVGRFAEADMRVAAVSRRGVAGKAHRDLVRGYCCDATVGEQVRNVLRRVADELGPPSLVVFNVGIWDRGGILDVSEELFEQAWRTGCFAGFLVGRAAAASMLSREAERSSSPARPDQFAAERVSLPLLHRNSRCGRLRKPWLASWDRRGFTSPTSFSTA